MSAGSSRATVLNPTSEIYFYLCVKRLCACVRHCSEHFSILMYVGGSRGHLGAQEKRKEDRGVDTKRGVPSVGAGLTPKTVGSLEDPKEATGGPTS